MTSEFPRGAIDALDTIQFKTARRGYDEDEVEGETRIVLRFHPRLAPVKAAVFPVPVCAAPRRSRPWSTWGIACAWIGVGSEYPSSATARRSSGASPSSEKSGISQCSVPESGDEGAMIGGMEEKATLLEGLAPAQPLAARMRPTTLDEVV